jgi:dCMP deaminase
MVDDLAKGWAEYRNAFENSPIGQKLKEYAAARIERTDKLDWDSYFLALAFLISERSHDEQTKHGCVIVDKDHHIIGTGYNGFPRNINEYMLPNVRPLKYDWMIHSEANAIYNSTKKPINCTAYVTGKPCQNCLLAMWQAGISEIVHPPYNTANMIENDNEAEVKRDLLLYLSEGKMKIRVFTPSLVHIKKMLNRIETLEKYNGV